MSDPTQTPQRATPPTPFVPPTPITPLPSSSLLRNLPTPQEIHQRSQNLAARHAKLLASGTKIEFGDAKLTTIDESSAETHTEQSNNMHNESENIDQNVHNDQQNDYQNENENVDEATQRQQQYDYHMINMQNQNAALQAQLQQTQEQLAHIQYQQSFQYNQQQQPQQMTSNSYHSIMKNIAKPDSFTGDMKADPDTWIAQMRNYLALTGVPLNLQSQFAGTYLKQQAATWYNTLPLDQRCQLVDFESMAKMILVRFRPLDVVGHARRQLAKLTQTGSVSTFNQLFMNIMQLIPTMNEDEKIHSYRTKLKFELQKQLITQKYHSLADIMNVALSTDALFYEHNMASQRTGNNTFGGNRNGSKFNGGKFRSDQQSNGSTTVSVNNVKLDQQESLYDDNMHNDDQSQNVTLNYAAPTPMNDAERQRCREQRLCFRCRQPGHRSSNCTIFTSSSRSAGLRPSAELNNYSKK